MKIYISAMATDKKSAMLQISNVSNVLLEHLIKIYLYPNTEYVDHWNHEIWNFFHSVPKLKGSNKLPNYKFIRAAVGQYEDMVDKFVDAVQDEYSALTPTRTDHVELEDMISTYFDWISEELSINGVVSPSQVRSKLEEIGF